MTYRDMSKYREGREQSKVAQTWINKYKAPFLKSLIAGKGKKETVVDVLVRDLMLRDKSQIAEAVVGQVLLWLNSSQGRAFLGEVYGIENVEAVPELKLLRQFGFEKQSFMTNVIYRNSIHDDPTPDHVLDCVRMGGEETAEIVADTMIGWLNSHVGRCFIRDAFDLQIPTSDPDGND